MQLFDIAQRHRSWLALRQSVVAENIANANTPGYGAQKVTDFAAMLDVGAVKLGATHASHISATNGRDPAVAEEAEPSAVTHSGNSVEVEKELLAAGEVRGGYALNVSVVKAFNRMLQTVTRS